ncbi:hypothetical protein ECC02_002145 [Trypanosoma cruzi]|uniref:Uncharacterized protein n=1 Tax=Trypanosoma cruzi TaxID=5693 RepID=A0A7J6YEX4_TRYCR|nr:hypothetical protein ECC02_002145 [Trypanosoma cruzi]
MHTCISSLHPLHPLTPIPPLPSCKVHFNGTWRMNYAGGDWRATLKEKIRSSEEALHRLNERQANHENARKFLSSAFDTPHVSSLDVPPRFISSQAELEDKVNCLQSQVKNCLTELETEQAVRSDGIRDVQRHLSIEMGEMRAMFQQLKRENEYLTETVRLLEKRLSSTSTFAPTGRTQAGVDVHTPATSTTAAAASTSSDLVKRVEELESAVTRQKRLLEDRQTRLDGVLREMVGVKIDSGMERMRSVAREAARDSVEDLLRLRLTAVQSMFNGELQKVMESSGFTAEVAQATERLFHQMEKDVLRRVDELDSAVDAISHGSRQHERVLNDMESRIVQKVTMLERELEASRREMRDGIAKNAQAGEERTAAAKLALESTVAERIAVACKSTASKDDVFAAVTASQERLEQQCSAICDRLTATVRAHDTAAEKYRKGVAQLEKRLDGLQDATEEMRHQIVHVDQLAASAKGDVEKWGQRLREALTASEEARAVAKESAACAQKAEDETREGLARIGVELQKLSYEHEKSTVQIRQLNEKLAAAEAHHAATRVTLDELSSRCTSTLPPLSARVDAVHRTVQDVCVVKLEENSQAVTELRTLHEQLQANASSMAKTDARQISDLRREFFVGMQSVEERVLQAVRDTQQESSTGITGLRALIDRLNASVKTHDERFASKNALDVISEGLAERVVELEGRLDTVARQVAQDAKRLSSPSSPSEPLVSVLTYEKLEREVENLRRRVDDVQRNALNEREDVEHHMRASMQEEVDRFKQLLHRLREDTSSQMQKLRLMLSEEAENRSQQVEEASQREMQRLQLQMDRLREVLGPRRLVSAILDEKELLSEVAEALQGAFASRKDTDDSIARVKQRVQQAEQQLHELEARCDTHGNAFTRQMETYESSQRLHAERLASLELQQEKVVETSKRWQEESRKDQKREMEQLTVQFDERLKALQSATVEVELQTHSMLSTLQNLQEDQMMLQREVTKTVAAQQFAENHIGTKNDDKNDDPEDNMNEHEVWKAQLTERIDLLESKTDATACSTADAFDTLRESIEHCVTLFVQEAASTSLLQDSDVSANELTGLDSVLLFLLGQLCQAHDALQALQKGALGTLELVQHHEDQLALLPSMRSLALLSARQVEKLSEVIGLQFDLHVDSSLVEQKERELGKDE